MVSTFRKAATLFAVGLLALAGCGSTGSGSSTSSGPSASHPGVRVGVAYDLGGRGDLSFNDAAAAGLDKAKAELAVEANEVEAARGATDAQREQSLTVLADAGYNPIVAVGFAYSTAIGNVARSHPQVSFAIVDADSPRLPNVANLVFAANQGSYLVGAIAAQASKTGTVGFVGGVRNPVIQQFQAGYQAGARAINPRIRIQLKYLTVPPDLSGFASPAKARLAAADMYRSGADVVYHAAGASGAGVFQAAAAAGKYAIGVDSDQYLSASAAEKPLIITSMLKRVDVAVFDFINSFSSGTPLVGVHTFDLAQQGVGYAKSNPAVQPYEARTDALRQQIIAGTITAPEKP